jgi:hypothetical protein
VPLPIEQYALIGDFHTAALVGKDGSIDWLCFPRFDSPACFAALLGTPEHGRWQLVPTGSVNAVRRRYRGNTLILETEYDTDQGSVRLTDFMPLSDERWDLVRRIEGLSGAVQMRMELVVRFDYGNIVPWVRRVDGVLLITAGPDTLELTGTLPVAGEGMKTVATFSVAAGQSESFNLNYRPSHLDTMPAVDAGQEFERTEFLWNRWAGRCKVHGRWDEAVVRSLITLKALTYRPTGGIIAAPTTSLPERLGGVRNWDYRYCWLRDATFTLNALLLAGYVKEAIAWRGWLLRAAAGAPEALQILYGVTGVRRLDEYEIDWLPGYGGAAPVRVGNAASRQFQLDVYGEIMDTLHTARLNGLDPEPPSGADRVSGVALETPRRRDLGGAGPAAALHALESHGLGSLRSRHQGRRAGQSRGAARAMAKRARCDPCGSLRAGLRSPTAELRPVVRIAAPGRESAAYTPGGLPASGRCSRARHHRGHRARIAGGRPRDALFDRDGCRCAARGRGSVPALFVLACGLLCARRPTGGG